MQRIVGAVVRTEIEGKAVSFFVNDESDLIQGRHACGEFYEIEELNIIKKFFEGGCFLDIGANVGNHAIYIAKFLAPVRIICIEPNPAAIDLLLINCQLNDLTTIIDTRYLGIGLASSSGKASLHNPQTNNMGAVQLVAGDGKIPLAVGDDLLHTESPSFIKLDVEGMELSVLQGLERLIDRCSPRIFVEVDNQNLPAFEEWRQRHHYFVSASYKRYPQNENFLLIRG